MNVSLETTVPLCTHDDIGVPSIDQRLDTRNAHHYGQAHFNDIGDVHLAHQYNHSDCQIQLLDVLKLVSTTGTGRCLLADLKALSLQGIRIAIGPRDDDDSNDTQVPLSGVSTTVDGQVLWDCCYRDHGLGALRPSVDAYKRLIRELVQVRNLAAEKALPGIPPLQAQDVEAAFMAELAVATAPAFAASQFRPPLPAWSSEPPEYMPEWRRGPVYFDSLGTLMPAWFTGEGKRIRDDVIAVLNVIQETSSGKRLLGNLWVYGRSRAVLLIHHSASGTGGTQRIGSETPIWCFNKAKLAEQAQSTELTGREARASGAFRQLLQADRALASKLGMLPQGGIAGAMQAQFEKELIEARNRRMDPVGTIERRMSSLTHMSPSSNFDRLLDGTSGESDHVPAPRSSASSGHAPFAPGSPAARTSPMPTDPSSTQAAAEDFDRPPAGNLTGSNGHSTQDNGVARWLLNSWRAFNRPFNQSPSPPMAFHPTTAAPNLYTREPEGSAEAGGK